MRRTPEVMRQYCEDAWQRKLRWSSLVRECYWYSCPGMDPYFGDSSASGASAVAQEPGQYRHDHLFDSTLSRAAIRLASRMSAEVFPPGRDWAQMEQGPGFAPEERSNNKREREIARLQTMVFSAIHASNFYLAAEQMCLDGIISGTGVMRVGGATDGAHLVSFEPVSQATVALERGAMGAVWGFHRKLWLTRIEMIATWPQAKVSKPENTFEEQRKRYTVYESTYLDPLSGVWHYDVVVNWGEGGDLVRVWQEDLLVCPWVAWRYQLLSGEVQGRSPVMQALPDARTVNHALRTWLESVSVRAAGIYTALEGDIGINPETIAFGSGEIIPVASNKNENPSIRPLELSGDPQLNQQAIADLRESIERTMLAQALPPTTGPVRSATEIAERQREAMMALGGPYLRLAEEVGRPILRAVAYDLARKGLLRGMAAGPVPKGKADPMPLMLDGTDVELKFVSPLVTAQQLADAENTLRWSGMSQEAAGPQAWQAGAKIEDIPEELGMKLGINPDLIRPKEERGDMLAQAQAAPQQAAPAQPMPMAA